MICPHCQASLKYKERRGRHCDRCTRRFALEPRDTPLRLHDLRFKRAVQILSADDTLFFTPGQLRHFLCRKAVGKAKSGIPDIVADTVLIMAVLGLGGFISLAFRSPVPILIALVVVGLLIALRPLLGRQRLTLPLPADTFARLVLARWREAYGSQPGRLLDPASLPAMPPAPAPDRLRMVLVCSEPEILDCLRANGLPERLGLGLLPAGPPFSATEQALLDHLRMRPRLPVLLLHDASPAGSLLAGKVRRRLNLHDEHHVIDLGLRPRQAIAQKLMILFAWPPKALLAQLQQQVAVNNSHRMSATGVDYLAPEEYAWLKNGYYSPLLALTPAQLIRLVERAVERVAAARPAAAEDQDQARARAVGFMTWPAAS